ncbi:SpaA isopeptide-forming pilin-related protein [Paraclostridium bifermentans]|uniref:SpaA isopeptide-forming pilin-related protein n=1 Tax=Paraclostridium bifermentans TaxID=1490 RepID=UPI00374FC00A
MRKWFTKNRTGNKDKQNHSKLFMALVGAIVLAFPIAAMARNMNESSTYKVLGQNATKHIMTTVKKFDDGTYAYCLEEAKASESGDYNGVTTLNDPNIYKCIKYGYPNQSWYSGANAEKLNYYVTQVAVWSFTEGWDDAKINSFIKVDSGAIAPSIDTDANKMKQNILNLRHQVLNDTANHNPSLDFAPHSISMKGNPGEGVQSEWITVNGNNITGNAEIALNGAPSGSKVVNESGQATNSIPIGHKFKIEVPNSGNKGTFGFSINGKGTAIKAVKYEIDGSHQALGALDPIAVTVPAGTQGTVNWDTPLARSDIKLQKVNSEDNKPLPNATFALYKDGKEIARETSGADGIMTFKDQAVGTYQVKEIAAPTGFVLDSTMHTVTFEKDKVATIKMPNKPIHAQVYLRKVDSDTKKPLVGAEFVLKQNGAEKYRVTTDKLGIGTIKDVKYGEYDICEIKAPTGYNILKDAKKINITTEGQKINIDIPNKIIKGNVKILKTDADNKQALKGVEFGIYQGDKEISKGTTGEDGTLEFKDLSFGKYTIKELKPAEGFLPIDKTWDVEIKEQGKTIEVPIENNPIKGKVQIVKIDANDEEKPVKDAKFHVYKASDLKTPIADLTTDENGFAYTEDLRYGDYVIQEYNAPTSYYINDKQYPVSIKEHGKVVVQYIVNNPVEFRLKVIKTDNEEKAPLVGAQFQIHKDGKPIVFEYQLDNKVVKEDTFITDKDGVILLPKELGAGEYSLVETKAPQGYTKAQPIPFTIDRNTKFEKDDLGNILTINVEDELIRGNVKLVKTDYNNKPLEGVQFELYSKHSKDENLKKNAFVKLLDKVKDLVKPEKSEDETKDSKEQAPKGVDVKETTSNENPEDKSKQEDKTNKDANAPEDNSKDKEVTKEESKDKTQEGTKDENTNQPSKDNDISKDDKDTSKDSENKDNKESDETKLDEVDKNKVKDLKANENLLKETPKVKEGEDQLVGLYQTDDKGQIVVKDLKYGEYYFKEVKTKTDYILDQKPINFKIDTKDQLIELGMQNAKMGELELTKVDVSTGKVLANATFVIYSEDGKTTVVKGKTDANGKAVFKLKPGKYFYQEIEAPTGYKLDNKKFPFDIKPTGDIVKCKMTNTPIPVIPKTGTSVTNLAIPGGIGLVVGGTYVFLRSRRNR